MGPPCTFSWHCCLQSSQTGVEREVKCQVPQCGFPEQQDGQTLLIRVTHWKSYWTASLLSGRWSRNTVQISFPCKMGNFDYTTCNRPFCPPLLPAFFYTASPDSPTMVLTTPNCKCLLTFASLNRLLNCRGQAGCLSCLLLHLQTSTVIWAHFGSTP